MVKVVNPEKLVVVLEVKTVTLHCVEVVQSDLDVFCFIVKLGWVIN